MTNEASVSQVKPQLKMGKACKILSIVFSALGILVNMFIVRMVTQGMDDARYNYEWNLDNLDEADQWLSDLRLMQYHVATAFLILIGVSIVYYICYICIRNKAIPTTIYSCLFTALNVYLFTQTEEKVYAGLMVGLAIVVTILFFVGMQFKILPCSIVGVILALGLAIFGVGYFEELDFGSISVGIPYLNIAGVATLVFIYGISMSWQKHRIKHPKKNNQITYMQPVTYMQQVPMNTIPAQAIPVQTPVQQPLPTQTQDQIKTQ